MDRNRIGRAVPNFADTLLSSTEVFCVLPLKTVPGGIEITDKNSGVLGVPPLTLQTRKFNDTLVRLGAHVWELIVGVDRLL